MATINRKPITCKGTGIVVRIESDTDLHTDAVWIDLPDGRTINVSLLTEETRTPYVFGTVWYHGSALLGYGVINHMDIWSRDATDTRNI